jgi:HEAT repeat protein
VLGVANRADTGNEAPDAALVGSLVAALASADRVERLEAHQHLVQIGGPAIGALAEALDAPLMHTRWEAVSVLGDIGDPLAAPTLVRALEDQASSVRWLAAEGLVALERGGVRALLEALVERGDSFWLRRGAHHVLQRLVREQAMDDMAPVLERLDSVDPQAGASVAALAALNAMTRGTEPSA